MSSRFKKNRSFFHFIDNMNDYSRIGEAVDEVITCAFVVFVIGVLLGVVVGAIVTFIIT